MDDTFTSIYARKDESDKYKLRFFGRATFGTSLFFWLWAILNTLTMSRGFDVGMISFFTTLISSICLQRWIRIDDKISLDINLTERKSSRIPIGKWRKIFVVSTHALVGATYALGLWFALFIEEDRILVQFGVYCSIFSVLWFWSAYSLWRRISCWNYDIQKEDEEWKEIYNVQNTGNDSDDRALNIYSSSNAKSKLDDLYDFELGGSGDMKW